jgi:predicted transcriptional regulator
MLNIKDLAGKINQEADYTVREVAELTGVSYSCVLGHIKRENLKGRLIFGKMHINGADLVDYLLGRK